MKKFFWALMLVATTLSFVACEEDKPVVKPDDPTEEVCKDCGKNPCECEDEEVCPDCGKNPCECPDGPVLPEWCTALFEVNYTIDETAGYGFADFNYDELISTEGQTIYEHLGFATWEELAAAIGTYEEAVMFDRETQLFGIDLGSESDILSSYNTNGFGYWVDANGVMDAWGTETVRAYTEAYGDEETGYLAPNCTVGVMPGNTAEGDTYKFGMVFQRTGDEVLRAGVQITIKVEAFKDPEAGKYGPNPTAGTFDIDFSGTMSLSANEYDYDGLTFVDQFEEVKTKLGLTTYEFNNKVAEGYIADDSGAIYSGMILEGILPDGTTIEGTNFWLNADNAQTSWGAEDAAVCIEWFFGATEDSLYGHTCAMPSYNDDGTYFYGPGVQAAIGKTLKVTYRITYIPTDEVGLAGEPTVINMNYAITVAE